MANRVHDFGHRAPRPVESRAGRRPTPLDRDHPLFEIQRSAGNRAVSELVSNPSRSPGLLRALLLRDGPAAGPTPGGVQDVPIGQPAPATISPAELAAGVPAPPNTVTYGGGGSSAAPSTAAPASTPTPAGGTPAPAPDPSATTAGPATSPATTTATAPPTDDSHAHLDPTLTVDPFNVTLTLTVADLHAWRSSHHLADVDFLADPSVAISVGTDPGHAVAGQAAVNLMLVHIKQNGESVLDLGFGPSVSVDGSGASVGGQATAEYHVTDRASITFTATATPVPNGSGGLDVNSSAIVGAAFHFP